MSSRIVSIRLWGGLCNRLFQIACCYGYAEKYNLKPIFYKSFFNHNEHTNQDETLKILKQLIPNIQIDENSITENDFYIIEVCGDFACKYIDLELPSHSNKNILLKGYFQSEKYFPILEVNKFLKQFCNSLSIQNTNPANTNLSITNKSNPRYFIHIRLGDYEGHYLHYLGYKKYLQNAIELILNKQHNAIFMICSNEKDKNKILKEIDSYSGDTISILSRIKYEFEIDSNPELYPLQTLKSMALCDGGICLNSSFSWFGAYLSHIMHNNINANTNANLNVYANLDKQIYIMPNKWFNERYIAQDSYKDIYPEWNNLVILDL